jgi:hypothetical protein
LQFGFVVSAARRKFRLFYQCKFKFASAKYSHKPKSAGITAQKASAASTSLSKPLHSTPIPNDTPQKAVWQLSKPFELSPQTAAPQSS